MAGPQALSQDQVIGLLSFGTMLESIIDMITEHQEEQDVALRGVVGKLERTKMFMEIINRERSVLAREVFALDFDDSLTRVTLMRSERNRALHNKKLISAIKREAYRTSLQFTDLLDAASSLATQSNPELIVKTHELIQLISRGGDEARILSVINEVSTLLITMYTEHSVTVNSDLRSLYESVYMMLKKVSDSTRLPATAYRVVQMPGEDEEQQQQEEG